MVEVKQTETPAFKRWFGDSKVMDASGNPMVVYHGTSKDKPFSSFTRNAQGTWFTADPAAASSYAATNDSQKVVYEDGRYVAKNTSSQVFPVYLSIKNPLKVEGEVLKKWKASVNYRAANKMLVGDAKYRGYDGLMFGEGVFVAFEPTQIKSAIGNKGTFDPKDSNITNPRQVKCDNKGININDKVQDYTGQILRGEKTIETRPSRSLDSRIGKRTGIVRTGAGKATLVGYAVIGEPVVYDSVAKFRKDQSKHRVAPGSIHDIKGGLKYGYPLMQVETVTPKELTSQGRVIRQLNPYTKPDLRERLKRKVMAGDKGGSWGQWSARKAQLLAAEYEKAGGGYTGRRSASQKSLSKWSKQDWRTKSGKPSLETGERYLPAKAIKALSAAEYAATTRAKRSALGQFSRQPRRIAMKTKEFRNPMIRTKLSRILEPGDRVLDYDRAQGEDLYRLWDMVHTDKPLTKEALTEIEGLLDDDGVLVIQSGEEPSGLQDHFRRATRYQGMLLVQGPMNPEQARINTEKLRRDL